MRLQARNNGVKVGNVGLFPRPKDIVRLALMPKDMCNLIKRRGAVDNVQKHFIQLAARRPLMDGGASYPCRDKNHFPIKT